MYETSRESRHTIQVQWGDCDPAGIVFYPNYFRWFDEGLQRLLEAVGHSQRTLAHTWGVLGVPLVDASARFAAPVRHGDRLEALTQIEHWGERSFTVYHRFDREGRLAVEGREVRVWAAADEDGGAGIRALPVPEEFKALFRR